ncbi:MAG: acetyl-CoA carboxylase biotin carboxyl carrier protein [Pseudomonadota bacterium]|nr:acetyl-CoA carboxylase biotin carboxyl carrier protein [Pseudomonadota bacterium]
MADTTSGAEGMKVDPGLVRQLAELLTDSDLSEIEVQDGARRIVVKRTVAAPAAPVYAPAPQAPAHAPSIPASTSAAPEEAAANHPGAVKSPMVGTVYLSAEPGAKPFVSPGDKISQGDTLLIVEAMKVMNPITAPRAGTVAQVLVDSGQPVEYDQPLVILE